jgi:spore maturation protein CgeB
MIKLYSRSRINLGFAGVGHSRKLMCLKGRDFEVPMSGGLYLTQNNPELSLVYDVDRDLVTYGRVEDCAGKIKRLLANPGEAARIRDSGRKRALRDHTWEKRFHDLFRATGLMR